MRWLLIILLLPACGPRPMGPADAGADAGASDAGADGGMDMCAPLPEATCTNVPTFTELTPVFQQRCQSCHDGSPTGPWPLVTYQHVADWQDQVRAEIVACTMPPLDGGAVITFAERQAIFTWVRCGRPK